MDKTDKPSRRSRDERTKDRSHSSKDHQPDTKASYRGRHDYKDSGSGRHRDDSQDHHESFRDSSSRRYRDDSHDDSLRDSRSRRHQDGENDESASRRHFDDENGAGSRRRREVDRHRHHHRDGERSRSEDRDKGRDSIEREGEDSMDRVSSRKRKVHGGGREENVLDKRVKVSEEKRERQRFGDRVMMDEDIRGANGRRERKHNDKDDNDKSEHRKVKVKEEKMADKEDEGARKVEPMFRDEVKDETDDGYMEKVKEENCQYEDVLKERNSIRKETGMQPSSGHSNGNHNSGAKQAVSLEKHKPFELVTNVLTFNNDSIPSKVSFTTTNENEGVNIIRSDGVPGKSSTDGASISVSGKSGSLSLDALAKAKRALQMQKQLTEKLKKIPALGKLSSPTTDTNPHIEKTKASHKPSSSVQTKFDSQSLPGHSVDASSSAKPIAGGNMAPLSGLTVEAVKRAQEVAARMGFHQDPQFAPLINMFPVPATDASIIQKPSKAPVLRLDAQGREIDEHGNAVNVHKHQNLSTLKVNINKQKKEAFQILRPELDAGIDSNRHFDESLGVNKAKLLRPKRMAFQFVEEGKWSRQAEITRFKNQFGEAQAKELRTKQSQLAKAKAEPDINPNLIEISDRVVIKEKQKDLIPDVEWWDLPLLPSKSYPDETSKDDLNMEKITIYMEHPLPIQPPAEPAPPPPQPLKLTKRENKKLRTQRRLAKEKDRQEMIRQGLIEPPKSKVKMSNLMRVLGSEATQDPTRLEMEIRSAAAEREQAHADRNIARKLTPSERREKKERKLFEDSSTLEAIVTIYRVNRLSHPKARFQVDVNAQENRLSGCAVICDEVSVIVVEGGKKSNKRYRNLMLKRIDWSATIENEEEPENADMTPNKCSLVWQGCVAKHSFNRFHVHQCRTEAAARKIFADAGVPHYWDLALNFSD